MQEFGFGFYDGISGLVTQPLEGAKKEGIAGLIKGFGKGIGGVVLKPGAGEASIEECEIYTDFYSHLGPARIYVQGDLQRDSEASRFQCTKLHSCSSYGARLR